MNMSHPLVQKARAVLFFAISIVGWFVYLGISVFLMIAAAWLIFFRWLIFYHFFREYFHYLGTTIGVELLKIWRAIARRLPAVFDFMGLPPIPQELAVLNPSNMPCLIVQAAFILAKPNPITFSLGVVFLGWYAIASLLDALSVS
jgi:hypothetical protein